MISYQIKNIQRIQILVVLNKKTVNVFVFMFDSLAECQQMIMQVVHVH